MPVREHDLHLTERVQRSGRLPQSIGKVCGAHLIPVDRFRADELAALIEHLKSQPADRERILAKGRKIVPPRNAVWRLPPWIEHDVLDGAREDRRLSVSLADNHQMRAPQLAVLPDLKAETGDVRANMAPAQVIGKPAPALQIDAHLIDLFLRPSIERLQRRLPDNAVVIQVGGGLKELDGAFHGIIEVGAVGGGITVEKADFDKTRPQRRNARALVAFPQGGSTRDPLGRSRSLCAEHRQFVLERPVSGLLRRKRVEAFRDGGAIERALQYACEVGLSLRRGPVRLDRDRIEFSVNHVRGRQEPDVGRETVASFRVARQRPQRAQTVLFGIQAVIAQALDRRYEVCVIPFVPYRRCCSLGMEFRNYRRRERFVLRRGLGQA